MTDTENRSEPAGADLAADAAAGGDDAAAALPQPARAPAAKPARSRMLTLATVFAVVLALLAALMTGSLWWQYRQFYVSLYDADSETQRTIDGIRDSVRRVDERIDALGSMLEAEQTRTTANDERIDALPAQLAVLEQRIAAAQGGSFEARADWLRAEAEYYLSVANSELEIAGNWETSIAALELADRGLAELANPAFRPVRDEIADELIALRSVRLPDIDGLAFSLSRLAERVARLPVRSDRPGSDAGGESGFEEAAPGFERLWLGVKRAVAGIIRVERSGEPVARVLSAEERRLVERQVVLELQLARIAALRGEAQAFQASLATAIDLLRRDFDTAAPEVEGAIDLLAQMQALEIAPAKPDISASLNRLRAIPAGDF